MASGQISNVSHHAAPSRMQSISTTLLHWASTALVATVWISSSLFGLYILAFYAGAFTDGDMARWNTVLPRLYERDTAVATSGIGLHFAAGGLILILGCIQLIGAIRRRFPVIHRWLGRVYVSAALLAGVGGLTFIVVKGTVGGTVMNAGFSLYGVLMILAALQTFRFARAGQWEAHRLWAFRLFALAIGSWLYRMEYGFWFLLANGAGHTPDFRGPFDMVMAFFFFIPNLLVVEALVRARPTTTRPVVKLAAAGVLAGATAFLLLGTYFFTAMLWGPAIVGGLVK